MKKTTPLLLLLFTFSSTNLATAAIAFEPFWTLKTETGQQIKITKIVLDNDTNNQPFFIYTDTDGKEGVITPNNFANLDELNAIAKANTTDSKPPPQENKAPEPKAVQSSEINIENTWHEHRTTYVLVSYTNKTNKTFTSAVTITCATKNINGHKINTNHRAFFAHRYGPITPGFSNSVKIPIPDVPGNRIENVSCSFNGW